MTQLPEPPNPKDFKDFRLRASTNRTRLLIILGLATIGVSGGLILRQWVYTRLVPLIEVAVVRLIDRPVEMGPIEGFSLTHVQFGETRVSPSNNDIDRAIVESVRVSFNPLEVIISRSLSFSVMLRSPTAIIEQDDTGQWLDLTINELEAGAIEFKLDAVQFEDAHVAIVPALLDSGEAESGAIEPRSPNSLNPDTSTDEQLGDEQLDVLTRRRQQLDRDRNLPQAWPTIERPFVWLQAIDGRAAFFDENQRISFDVEGEPNTPSDGGSFKVSGEVDRQQEDWMANAVIQTQDLDIREFLLLSPELPVDIASGTISSNLRGELSATNDISIRGTAQVQDFSVDVPTLSQPIELAQSNLQFRGQQVQIENTQLSLGSSVLSARGRIDLREPERNAYNLALTGDNLDIATVLRDVGVSVPFAIEGQVDTTVNVAGPLQQPSITGTLNQASSIQVDRVELDAIGARFSLSPDALELNTIQVSPAAGGVVSGNGQVTFDQFGSLSFALDASNIPGDAIARQYAQDALPETLTLGLVSAQARITGTVSRPIVSAQWQALNGTYPAQGNLIAFNNRLSLRDVRVSIGEGTVRADSDLSLDDQQWRANATVEQLPLATIAPGQADTLGPSVLDGEVILSGTLRDLSPAAIEADGQIIVSNLPMIDGPVTARGQWTGRGLQLDEAIAPNLQANGFIGFDFPTDASGAFGVPNINELDLDIVAQDVDLARSAAIISAINSGNLTSVADLTTDDEATATVPIAGIADFQGRLTGTLNQPTIDGTIAIQDLVVNDVAFDPMLTGNTRFTVGQGGTLNLDGQTDQLSATVDERYYPTEFVLRRGDILARGSTQGDRLLSTVENFPLGVLNLRPAANLGLGPLRGIVSGNVSVNLDTLNITDLSQLSASGDVRIIDPSLGHIEGDRFAGTFTYGNGVAIIDDGQLAVGSSDYDVTGRFAPTDDTLFKGQIAADNGNVQDLLVALKYFELQDLLRFFDPPQYGNAADLDTAPIRITEATLLRQLQRYAEISTLLRTYRREQAEATFFPALQELSGTISGVVDLTVSRNSGLTADFDLTGENWEWGEYDDPNQIIAAGSFSDNTITLLPFRFESGDTLIDFAGQVGQAEDSQGQLQITNVPADLVADFIRLPIAIEGNLNTTATVTGSIRNLQARGEFALEDGLINQTPIQETDAQFRYADARLILIGSMLVSDNDPISLTGSIPYRLPQGMVDPDSDEINLNIEVENDGLALLNLLNNQVNWTGGEANVSLQVGGTLRQTSSGIDIQPLATGFAELRNGSFVAEVLPAPLTDVTGTVQFNRDRIQVNNIRGQFSDGEFVANGIIPLAVPFEIDTPDTARVEVENTEPENTGVPNNAEGEDDVLREPINPALTPLTVDLNDLAVDVKGLYDGGVNGQVIVGGTALAPRLGGAVTLSDGRISLPDTAMLGGVAATQQDTSPFATLFSPPELDNLQVVLGNRLLITRAPILNFVATGDLVVNGPLNDFRSLMPDGIIRLRSGQVNVFTTQFNLMRGRDNVAIFRPSDGLDPFLNVRLATSILEQTRSPIPTSTAFAQSELSEVIDSSVNDFGGIETVRVQATVIGPASQIFENLRLSSSPSRSENEIIALIGGGFADTQGQDGSNLAIASLAGTALFTSIQNLLSNAIGVSDFRIFPAVITNDEREDGSDSPTSTLGIAAELGVDITSDLSISALQFLTLEEPTQFNLRYQINDELRLRGTSNFSDENRLVLEFETRF